VDNSTLTWAGFSAAPDVDFRYRIWENEVLLWVLTTGASLTGTSSGTNFSLSGFPVEIRPAAARQWVTTLIDDGVVVLARANMATTGTITFAKFLVTETETVITLDALPVVSTTGGWTASGTKGLGANFIMSYPLADS
jgi:hypothetical protein